MYHMKFGTPDDTARGLLEWLTGLNGHLSPSQARLVDDQTIELTDSAIRALKNLDEDTDGIVGYEGSELVMWIGGISYPLT